MRSGNGIGRKTGLLKQLGNHDEIKHMFKMMHIFHDQKPMWKEAFLEQK